MSRRLLEGLKQQGILVAFLLLLTAMAIFSPSFRKPANLVNIVRQESVHGIMAVGMTFVVLTGGIDLSVGAMLALAGVVCAMLEHAGCPIAVSVSVTLLLGGLMGLVNGVVITWGRVTPFIVTLGMMSITRGLAHILTHGEPISSFDRGFRWIGAGEVLRVPVPVLLLLASVAVAAVTLGRTRFGRYVYAIGGNAQAARLSGIAVRLHTTLVYVVCSAATALGAVVLTSRLNAAESIAGTGDELDVIAAVVIGGTSLMGGRGTVLGTLLGVLLIGTINNAMNLLEIPPHYQFVVKGAIIIAAAILDRLRVK